jgi:hypothetical protein
MPGSKTSSGSAISVQQNITINAAANGGHVNITRITDIPRTMEFSTKNILVDGEKKKVVYVGMELILHSGLRFTPDNATVKAPARFSILQEGAYQKVGLIEATGSYTGSNNLMVMQNIPPFSGNRYLLRPAGVSMPADGDQV